MGVTYDPTTCNTKLTNKGYTVCQRLHCSSLVETESIHLFCAQKQKTVYTPVSSSQYYSPIRTPHYKWFTTLQEEIAFQNSKEFTNGQWENQQCWCCCACYAYDTPIATPDGTKAVQDFKQGDAVLSGSTQMENKEIKLTWASQEIVFSSGTSPTTKEHNPPMVFINFGDNKSITVSADELFLLPSGKVIQACKLTVNNQLVSGDGKPLQINALKLALYSGGIHHISALKEFNGSINGHLLNSNGVVTGGYFLQIHNDEIDPDFLAPDHDNLPTIGSKEYEAANKDVEVGYHSYHHKQAPKEIALPENLALFSKDHDPIPDDAYSFINVEQEADLFAVPKLMRPFGNHTGVDSIYYLFNIHRGFYPKVNFCLDWENINPNAYAFNAYNEDFVVIPGGLVRINGLNLQGLAVIIAQAIASLYARETEKKPGRTCRAEAAYYGIGVVMRNVWNTTWFEIVNAGIQQIKTLFSHIEVGKSGNPNDCCADPSIQCREESMESALYGFNLPSCAGVNPVQPKLKVTGDEVGQTSDGNPFVTINFSEAVDVSSAENTANYEVEPKAKLTSAKVNKDDQSKVTVTGDFTAKTNYLITVSNVTSADGAELDPENNSASFKTL